MSRKPYDDRLTGWKMNKIKSDPAQGSERFTPAVLLAAKPPTSNHEHGSRNIPSPKQNLVSSTGRAAWYPYYAGYSPSFVRFILENSNLRSDAVVLDPWNGAGTTTQVATDLGYDTFGFDLNPVMVLVAKARLLNEGQRLDIISCVDKIARKANRFGAGNATHDDALGTWFSEQSVTWIRHLERAIRDQFKIGKGRVRENVSNYESDAAFAYMMLFRTLRSFLTGFKVSNPAWLKPAGSETDLVTISRVDLLNKFKITCDKILKDVDDGLFASLQGKRGESRIELANSVSLPLASCTADIVVASPPYCTRIDYAIATRVELAILNVGATDALRKLRENMIGTSTIDSKPVTIRNGTEITSRFS